MFLEMYFDALNFITNKPHTEVVLYHHTCMLVPPPPLVLFICSIAGVSPVTRYRKLYQYYGDQYIANKNNVWWCFIWGQTTNIVLIAWIKWVVVLLEWTIALKTKNVLYIRIFQKRSSLLVEILVFSPRLCTKDVSAGLTRSDIVQHTMNIVSLTTCFAINSYCLTS